MTGEAFAAAKTNGILNNPKLSQESESAPNPTFQFDREHGARKTALLIANVYPRLLMI